MKWFRKRPSLPVATEPPRTPQEYPSGIAVRTEKGTFRIHSDGRRYRIPTDAILESWSFPVVANSTEAALVNYPIAVSRCGFRDGSLLNNIADGKLYLASHGKLRHVTNPAVLDRLGNPTPVVVSDAEIKLMKQGEPIN